MVKIKFNDSNIEYDVIFRRINQHIIHLVGSMPQNTSGFKAYKDNVLLGDYSSYTTIYRTYAGGYELSDNGSVEPTKTVKINATWEGGESKRPSSLLITTTKGSVTLTTPSWEYNYTVQESDDVLITNAPDLDDFRKTVSNHNVEYSYTPIDPVPSQEERIADLEEAVCELYEMIGE